MPKNALISTSRRVLASSMLAFALSACGGGDGGGGGDGAQAPPHEAKPIGNASGTVGYRDGGELVVKGKIYARGKPTGKNYTEGDLLLSFKEGSKSQVISMLGDFRLPISTELEAIDMLSIKVPLGYEEQWRSALADQPGILGAYLNELRTLIDSRPREASIKPLPAAQPRGARAAQAIPERDRGVPIGSADPAETVETHR